MKQKGVLLSVFSLPGKYGIGDFGQCAYDFIDILDRAGADIWQVLPLNPVGFGHSPYQPYSSFAGETMFIDLDSLYKDGLLKELPEIPAVTSHIDYEAVAALKEKYFREAFSHFRSTKAYRAFRDQEWVLPYAVFSVFQALNDGKSWNEWPEEYKNWPETRDEKLIAPLKKEINYRIFLQYEFYRQWDAVKKYANDRNISLMGDIPFYVGLDSQEVWCDREQFLLDEDGYPTHVAGCPPDYFSATGQRWGNPIYNWETMKNDGFTFWKTRLQGTAKLFDLIRVDHFRAFDTYWKIPASCPTAVEGAWIEAPGYEFFDSFLPEFKGAKIIAEDLGEMRPEVYVLRDHYEFPGMNVLQFTLFDRGFGVRDHMVTYTGTHDNEMVRSWYESLSLKQKKQALYKLHASDRLRGAEIGQAFARYCYRFPTDYSIVSVQDILGLTNDARVNFPGTVSEDNWTWKLQEFGAFEETLKSVING